MTMANAPLWDRMANHIAWFVFRKNRNIFAKGAGQNVSIGRWPDLPVGQSSEVAGKPALGLADKLRFV
jgi:hypothetical protein